MSQSDRAKALIKDMEAYFGAAKENEGEDGMKTQQPCEGGSPDSAKAHLGAGAVFTGVDEYSQDIGSSQISHSLYNLLSLGIQGSVLGAVIGPPPSSLLPQVAVIAPVAVGLIVLPNLLVRRAKTGGLRLR